MELRLQQVLQENRADFIDSLRLSGINVKRGGWSADAVDQNAQAGALSLIQFVSQENISDRCRDAFLRTIACNLDGEERTFVMAWIYTAYERAGRFPPYAIIQHMVDPALFCEYCVSLQKYLHMYLQGYFSRTVNIVVTSQIRRCFSEIARVDFNHPLYKRCTRCPANHSEFLRTFSQKGTSQHCKSLVPYCMIHTMNGRLSQEV